MGPLKVLVCGGGNGAHALAGLASTRENVECRVLTLYENEAERWMKAMANDGFKLTVKEGEAEVDVKAKPFFVTKDPGVAVPGCEVIFIVVPAFAHDEYFAAIRPYLENGTIIVGLPSKSGFEFALRAHLGEKAKSCTVMSYETLPWACRTQEFGKHVAALGTKQSLRGSISGKPNANAEKIVQFIIGDVPKLEHSGHYLGILGLSLSGMMHPAIMYNRWENWDGKPLKEAPLFYHGVDDKGGELLTAISKERMEIKDRIEAKHHIDLSNVISLEDWLLATYRDEISDQTDTNNFRKLLNTNKAYHGLKHPMVEIDECQFIPDFNNRYLVEDLPFALIVTKGIALLADVPTPNLDKVILWCQKVMQKEWLVDGKLVGEDMKNTRAPQRYDFTKLEELL